MGLLKSNILSIAGAYSRWACLLLVCFICLPKPCLSQEGSINFAQSQLVVNEGVSADTFTTVQIPLEREGGTSGSIVVSIEVRES